MEQSLATKAVVLANRHTIGENTNTKQAKLGRTSRNNRQSSCDISRYPCEEACREPFHHVTKTTAFTRTNNILAIMGDDVATSEIVLRQCRQHLQKGKRISREEQCSGDKEDGSRKTTSNSRKGSSKSREILP